MSHDRSPRGATGTVMGTGTGAGTSNIRISPSYEEALGGPEGYVRSSRRNDGAGSSALHDVTDDARTYSDSNSNSTYEGGRTRRDDDTAAAAYISNRKKIEQKHDTSKEKDTPESEKELKFHELNTEEMISKREKNTQNQNVEIDSRRLSSRESEISPYSDHADKNHGLAEIQYRPEGFLKEVQVEVKNLLEVREGLKDVESTTPVIGPRGDDVIYNDNDRQRERGTKVNEEMNIEVGKKRNEEINSIQKEKEEKRMIEEREEEKEQLREKDRERNRAREEEKEKELSDKRSREEEEKKKMQLEVARIEVMEKEKEKVDKSGKVATSDMEVQSNVKSSNKAGSGVIEKEDKDISYNNSLKGANMKTEEVENVLQGDVKIDILDAKIRQPDVKIVQPIVKLQMNEDKSEESERSEDDEESKKDFSISMRSKGSESFTTSYQSEDQSQDRDNKDKDSTQDSNHDGNYSVVENDFDEQIIKEAVMRELKERNLKLGAEKDKKMIVKRDLGSENPRYKNEDSKHDDNINYISSEWASMIENNSEDENDDVVLTKKHQTQESNQGLSLKSRRTDKDEDKDERHTNETDISTNSDAWLDQTCSVDVIENEDKDENERERRRSNIILEQFDGLNTQELLASSLTAQEKENEKELEKKCEGKSDAEKEQIRKEYILIQEEVMKKSADDLAISEARASVILRRKLKLEKDALAASVTAAAAAATLSSHTMKGSDNYKSVTVPSTAPSSSSSMNNSSRMIAHVTAKDDDEDREEELGSNDDDNDDDDVLNESKSVKGVSSSYSILT